MDNMQPTTEAAQAQARAHTLRVIVNGREKFIAQKELSFAEVVALSGLPSTPTTVFTVTYRRGEGHKPDGMLVEGQTVKVKDGMIFNVTATDKS